MSNEKNIPLQGKSMFQRLQVYKTERKSFGLTGFLIRSSILPYGVIYLLLYLIIIHRTLFSVSSVYITVFLTIFYF